MSDIKPIETKYSGYRFRSRLEARWAVFMDRIGVQYEYEAEGYDLGGVYYLPDFFLPKLDCFVEIKPFAPLAEEARKVELLANYSGKMAYIFFGQPGLPCPSESDSGHAYFPGGGWDNYRQFCPCLVCGSIEIQYDGRSERNKCRCNADEKEVQTGHVFKGAYEFAKSHRFERGGCEKVEKEALSGIGLPRPRAIVHDWSDEGYAERARWNAAIQAHAAKLRDQL